MISVAVLVVPVSLMDCGTSGLLRSAPGPGLAKTQQMAFTATSATACLGSPAVQSCTKVCRCNLRPSGICSSVHGCAKA